MADFIIRALVKQEEASPGATCLGIDRVFGILDRALNRGASRRDSRAPSAGDPAMPTRVGPFFSRSPQPLTHLEPHNSYLENSQLM